MVQNIKIDNEYMAVFLIEILFEYQIKGGNHYVSDKYSF